MKIKALMAGALVFAAGNLMAQVQPSADTAKPEATPVTGEAKDPDKIRCERMSVTGSRLGGKVCHTEAEWALIDKRADELMHDIERVPVGFIEGSRPSRTSGSLADGL